MIDATENLLQVPSAIHKPAAAHKSFELLRSKLIQSLNLQIEEYRHRITGAMHYHMSSDDTENVFLVAFRTVPMDNKGVAHILEHTALCGSKKYPVRDPFFMMIRRSLNTFMNAFTSSDWTAYPFASQNKKDFNNLLTVYLDAAFFSRLHELDFAQEGHRLEFTEAGNADSDLQYKGVVFNEMKGAMSSTNSVLWQTMSEHLFPTSTYHYNSGGDPEQIPELSYEELLDFYKTHYHPGNAVFMTYGDISASAHQENFENLALAKFGKLDLKIEVTDEKRYSAPIKITRPYVAEGDSTEKSHVVLGWLLGDSTNLEDLFKAQLLSSVLLDNSSSPLLKVLETSSLGSSPSPMCGLEDSNREMSLMAGLEGCAAKASDEVESLILNTLETIAIEGVEKEHVEAALHQLELNQREISGDSYPYGLQLMLASLSTAMHRGDAISLLNIDPVLAELREHIKDEDFIPKLIRELILDNPHRVTLTLNPDNELAQQKIDAELSKLETIKNQLSDKEQRHIIAQTKALEERQLQQDDPGVLPKVGLEDVPQTMPEPERSDYALKSKSADVAFYGQGTNGLSYQQIVMPLPHLPEDLLAVLPLYTSCLTEFGVGKRNYSEVQSWQSQVSGGVNCFSSIRSEYDDVQNTQALLSFSSKCLTANHLSLAELLKETLLSVRFDEKQRLAELIEQICARKENSITGQGHSLAMSLASSKMSPTALLSHNFGGLEGIRRLKNLRDQIGGDEFRQSLLDKFQRLHSLIVSAKRQFLIVAEDSHAKSHLADLELCWGEKENNQSGSGLSLTHLRERTREVWTTSTQVNFCAKAYQTVASAHEDNATLQVLAGFMRNGFLHRSIREQGGAYGGGASQDPNSASFRFFSYRDPRLNETLNDFDRAIDWVISETHPDYQLEEAVLGIISAMDRPSSPAGEAKQAYYNHLFGRTMDQRLLFRKRVLRTSIHDLKTAAAKYFDPKQASVGIISNRESVSNLNIEGLNEINL
jgi:Zn-dependent M16 (insulinase) family peptidase